MNTLKLFKGVLFNITESRLYLEEQVLEPANGFAVNPAKSKGKDKNVEDLRRLDDQQHTYQICLQLLNIICLVRNYYIKEKIHIF